MRALPSFPSYNVARPPVTKRWLAASALITLLTGGFAALAPEMVVGNRGIAAAMFISLLVMTTLWLFRQWYYRGSVLNASIWREEVESIQQQWWTQHRQQFGLQEIVLIGPAGSTEPDWARLFRRELMPPEPRKEGDGLALRIARTFSLNVEVREKQLARTLVLQWKNQCQDGFKPSPSGCFWSGSEQAWQAFVQQMSESFPLTALPAVPQIWNGEETLAELAETFQDAGKETQILIAGCQSLPAYAGSPRPAGESAVLWLVGAEGATLLTRGEYVDTAASESVLQICQRAQEQSETEIPEYCMLFSHPELPELARCGWNITQHLQDDFWGETGQMEPLIVMSLAAIFARTQQQPCGWIATDPQHTLALGIVKPHG